MVELRKRKTPPPAPARPAKKKAPAKSEKPAKGKGLKATVTEKVEAVKEKVTRKSNGEKEATPLPASAPKVGDSVDLAAFGGEIETHEGTKTTLAKLLEESKSGVVLFTYPKASTPGCKSSLSAYSRMQANRYPAGTKQACLFRDSYEPLTATGYGIYGLSNDSPKANTTFKTKQNLPYPLLSDPKRTLISAIGLSKGGTGTTRGVFVIDKAGKVLAAEPGSPDGTVAVVKKLVGGEGAAPAQTTEEAQVEDAKLAKTASEVADTAATLDSGKA